MDHQEARKQIALGNAFPFDAPDEWWEGRSRFLPKPVDNAHSTARGIIADLEDRRGVKQGFVGIDEDTRKEIVDAVATIIREGMR